MAQIRIDDVRDERLDEYRAIGEPELVRRRGLFVAEGRLVVRRLLEDPRYRVRSVLVSPAAYDQLADSLAPLVERIPVYVCGLPNFGDLAGYNIHRGCLALAERPFEESYVQVAAGARRVVVLEAAADPDNVGGVFRNAAAFGVDAVLLSPTCCDPLYRKAVRTSMAATLRVRFARVEPWPGGLNELQRLGYGLAAFTPHREARPLASFAMNRPPDRLALLFGSEGSGLTGAAQDLADVRVRIPVSADVDSLNLAVATGIALSWLTRDDLLA